MERSGEHDSQPPRYTFVRAGLLARIKSLRFFRLAANWEAFRVATGSLRANKLRTALTLVGVVVGVAAVIAVVTIIKGLDQTVASTFSSQGSTVFTISKRPQVITSREDFIRFNRRKDMAETDADSIARLCTLCWRTGIAVNAQTTIKAGDQSSSGVRIRGLTFSMFAIEDTEIIAGRPWNDAHDLVSKGIISEDAYKDLHLKVSTANSRHTAYSH